jgi:hypothetical protein
VIGFPTLTVPAAVRFCEVESTGTRAGGAFTARVTFCHPPPLSLVPVSFYSELSITGSIDGNRLTMTVHNGVIAPGERYDLVKVG